MKDRYAPPPPRRRTARKDGQHVKGPIARNRSYIFLVSACFLVSAVMNWVAMTATGRLGSRASHIEAYLRTFLISDRRQSATDTSRNRGSARSVRGTNLETVDGHDLRGGERAFSRDGIDGGDSDTSDGSNADDNSMHDDDDATGDEVEHGGGEDDDDADAARVDGEEKTEKDSDNERDSGVARPVEFGGPPPDEVHVGANNDVEVSAAEPAAAGNMGSSNIVAEKAQDVHLSIEEGGPPPIDGRGNSRVNHTEHSISGLSCARYGGPSDRIAEEMVYWQHIPSDAEFVSPLRGDGPTKYMTFEPDGGGWNNIRMAMETVISMAHAMGRTLVMPPEQRMYLIGKNDNQQKSTFSFADFYHIESMSREHAGLDVITMQDFLDREAMTGSMVNRSTGLPSFPPGNRTDWNGENGKGMKVLNEWMRTVTHVSRWNPDQCMLAFPASPGAEASKSLKEAYQQMREESIPAGTGPVPVDAPVAQRMLEVANGRSLCMYDEEMQKSAYLHFASSHKLGLRLLTHFYIFLFFEDYRWDTWNKRFVRDHLRYVDEIQCAAARVVHALRERARIRGTTANVTRNFYDSLHIRRGDLAYKEVKVDGNELYEASKMELIEGGTVFVATDEKNKDFFKPLREHYDLCFLDDFKHLFEGVNTNMYGMLDQLVASRGRVFYGTYFSTFTGFINRMRGYHADRAKVHNQNGTIRSYYFLPFEKRYGMASFMPPRPPFWTREFPLAWRDIDKGIGELPAASLKKKKLSQTPVIF